MAQLGDSSKTVSLTWGSSKKGGKKVRSLSCTSTEIRGKGKSTCTVEMSSSDSLTAVIRLSSDNPALNVPTSVTIEPGSQQAEFVASSDLIVIDGTATVKAFVDESVGAKTISLVAFRPLSISCSPNQVQAGEVTNCEVLLNSDTVDSETGLLLASSSQKFRVPASVTVRPGRQTVKFRAQAALDAAQEPVTLTANLGGEGVSQEVGVLSNLAPVLSVPGPQVVIFDSPIAFGVTASDPNAHPVTLTVTNLPSGALFDADEGFTWTPQSSQIGEHTVSFIASNSIGRSTRRSVQVTVVADKPIVNEIVNGANGSTEWPCSPGGLASILGTGFTRQASEAASSLPLPTDLAGVRVKINDAYVPLLYVSGTQVNIQCPFLPPGTPLVVVLESDLGASPPAETDMLPATPGIFVLGDSGTEQGVVIVSETGELAMIPDSESPGIPARPGDFISILATGLGPVDQSVDAGEAALSDPPSLLLGDVQAAIGDVFGEVDFAGLAPGFAGLYQVNVKIPSFAPAGGAVPLSLFVRFPDGSLVESNKVSIAIDEN